jgi:prepilin-type N-terminal cleavage/methylation domain-containing protein
MMRANMNKYSLLKNIEKSKQGFTLVELAIVLVIIGLLLATFLTPLTAQMAIRNNSETRADLNEIREALVGYALSHSAADGRPFLPCPDTDADGIENRLGALCANVRGRLPFSDLGLDGIDSWGNQFTYQVTQTFANSATGFILASAGDITVLNSAGGNAIAISIPAIVVSLGENGAVMPAVGADQLENTNLDNFYVNKDFAENAVNPYDDLVTWVSANILMNRMVRAGRLP